MKKIFYSLFFIPALLTVTAFAANVNMKEGEWETTMLMAPPANTPPSLPQNAPAPQSLPTPPSDSVESFPLHSIKECFSKKDVKNIEKIIPRSPFEMAEGCKMTEHNLTGNTLTYKTDCSGNYPSITIGKITYFGEKFEGKAQTIIDDPRFGKTTLAHQITGKRLGGCKNN